MTGSLSLKVTGGGVGGLKCSASHYISAIVIAESIKETPVDLCYSSQYLTLPSTCQNMSRGFILWGVISGSVLCLDNGGK